VQLLSGKTTFFVANQDNIDALPDHKVKALAEDTEALVERNKALTAEVKAASAGVCMLVSLCVGSDEGWHVPGACRIYMLTASTSHDPELARIKSTPTDAELAKQIDEVESKVRVQ
jgi:hypothetical protein